MKKKVIPGVNDLVTTHPKLIEEWDFERNAGLGPETLSADSGRVVWWVCRSCGNRWADAINKRIKSGRGCPNDSGRIMGIFEG